MDLKTKITRSLQSATCDKEALNRKILNWCRCFREVEKILNRGRSR